MDNCGRNTCSGLTNRKAESLLGLIKKLFGTRSEREVKRIQPLVDQILALEADYKALPDEALRAKTEAFKARYQQGETLDDLLPEAFATIREAADRVLGMRPYPVQLIGGIVLHQGRNLQNHSIIPKRNIHMLNKSLQKLKVFLVRKCDMNTSNFHIGFILD